MTQRNLMVERINTHLAVYKRDRDRGEAHEPSWREADHTLLRAIVRYLQTEPNALPGEDNTGVPML